MKPLEGLLASCGVRSRLLYLVGHWVPDSKHWTRFSGSGSRSDVRRWNTGRYGHGAEVDIKNAKKLSPL